MVVIVCVFIVCQTPALLNQIFWALFDPAERQCGRFHFYYTQLSDLQLVSSTSLTQRDLLLSTACLPRPVYSSSQRPARRRQLVVQLRRLLSLRQDLPTSLPLNSLLLLLWLPRRHADVRSSAASSSPSDLAFVTFVNFTTSICPVCETQSTIASLALSLTLSSTSVTLCAEETAASAHRRQYDQQEVISDVRSRPATATAL